MKPALVFALLLLAPLAASAPLQDTRGLAPEFPQELVSFGPASAPLLAGTGTATWDRKVRERGWIMREGGTWHLWYTGYNDDLRPAKFLGYATSPDGLTWTRWPGNPLTTTGWVEDMCVVKQGDTYYMFAEGLDDVAHLLTSTDRVHWQERSALDIRQTNGQPISAGPRGTPAVWVEGDTWWLFYERADLAVYAATSKDLKTWTNVTDDPVLARGPEAYDRYAVAVDQIIRHNGRYYAYYHASALPKWGEWTTCMAVSDDLVHWRKYAGNPVLPVNPQSPGASSSMLIHDGTAFRLYTTHPDVRVHRSLVPGGVAAVAPGGHPWLGSRVPISSLDARIAPPAGYRRVDVPDGSFAQWLRRLPVKPERASVRLFDGRDKANQDVHVAVIDLDVGPKDLQQCADAVMRLRAEWQFARSRHDQIRFGLTSGAVAEFARWSEGFRPVVGERNVVRWVKTAPPDSSYASFRGYLERVFQYAGTASLSRELQKVADPRDVRSGDVFIKGGYPGHAVIVVDVAAHPDGRRVFLLAQSFMPAQDIHVLKNPADPDLSPWYSTDYGERLDTPEWTFAPGELRRFGS